MSEDLYVSRLIQLYHRNPFAFKQEMLQHISVEEFEGCFTATTARAGLDLMRPIIRRVAAKLALQNLPQRNTKLTSVKAWQETTPEGFLGIICAAPKRSFFALEFSDGTGHVIDFVEGESRALVVAKLQVFAKGILMYPSARKGAQDDEKIEEPARIFEAQRHGFWFPGDQSPAASSAAGGPRWTGSRGSSRGRATTRRPSTDS